MYEIRSNSRALSSLPTTLEMRDVIAEADNALDAGNIERKVVLLELTNLVI